MAGFGKMIIGQAGKKYGLHRPGAPAAKPGAAPKGGGIFGDDDDDDAPAATEDALKKLSSDKHKELMRKRAEKEMKKALAQDATIFDYDGALDGIHKEREEMEVNKKAAQKERGEVRYVHQLLEKTKERKKEDEKLFEKRMVKELEAEKEEFGETEKFVTAAYKRQLLATKAFEEEQKRLDELKERDDVRNKDSMADFYSSMLKGTNKASGAIVRAAELSKEKVPSKEMLARMTLGDLPEGV
eukprot:CAMPEP_0172002190 /NCGR_PEP_ID=MMETSP1041-20130122/3276_1 /TAXON_ID=464988 /ORGANISM="Hemiselmis andersenii, Strain CCMP439" /LENGTH=241 /DNA_ID=CAMNT_0012655891 /DNA_START=43 /DNA_END=765 /DNA_ORIENTATION=+